MPVMALAQRAGLADLADEHVRIGRRCGVDAQVKVACVVAGMIGGADSIDDLGLLRHGAMPALFGGVRAPSTLGSFLRSFTWGNVVQLEKVSRLVLAELARRAPLLPGTDAVAFVDIDSMQKRVYGHAKQGAAFGFTKIQGKAWLVRGLNALAATISTPLGAPVIAATRLRGGNAASARGAASFAGAAVRAARATGCSGTLVARADSAFYSAAFTAAVRAAGAFFSVTVQMNPHVKAAIAAIGEDAWTAIKYPRAIWDDQLACWVSDAAISHNLLRRRLPGQPRLRQGARRHAAPRPHRRRRTHGPPRTRPHHLAPARRLAPRTGLDQPLRSRLRTARPGSLTSPDPVTTPQAQTATSYPATKPRQPHTDEPQTSKRQEYNARDHDPPGKPKRNDQPQPRGGLRLSVADGVPYPDSEFPGHEREAPSGPHARDGCPPRPAGTPGRFSAGC